MDTLSEPNEIVSHRTVWTRELFSAWPQELIELAFPDDFPLLTKLGDRNLLPPQDLATIRDHLERRIDSLARAPIERGAELGLFCLLCYEAYGCRGTMTHAARQLPVSSLVPLSCYLLPDGTVVELITELHPVWREQHELREIGGSRRRWPFDGQHVAGADFRLEDVTACSLERLDEYLRSLNVSADEAEVVAWANRSLDFWRPRLAARLGGGLAQELLALQGSITPEHPDLERLMQALLGLGIRNLLAFDGEEHRNITQVWRDLVRVRRARAR